VGSRSAANTRYGTSESPRDNTTKELWPPLRKGAAEKVNDYNIAPNAVLDKTSDYPARRSSRSPAVGTAVTLGFLIGASASSHPITLK
jgi:hypothetical protein